MKAFTVALGTTFKGCFALFSCSGFNEKGKYQAVAEQYQEDLIPSNKYSIACSSESNTIAGLCYLESSVLLFSYRIGWLIVIETMVDLPHIILLMIAIKIRQRAQGCSGVRHLSPKGKEQVSWFDNWDGQDPQGLGKSLQHIPSPSLNTTESLVPC